MREEEENRSCGGPPASLPAMKTRAKWGRRLTLRIGFGEKHRQILLGDFRKGLDVTLSLKEKEKHRHLLHMDKGQGAGKYSSGVSWLRRTKANEQQIIPDITFQWPVCKELFLSIEIQKYSCFKKGQTGEQRRSVVCWGVRHLTPESLQSTAVPTAMPNPSDVPLPKRNILLAKIFWLLLLIFSAAVEAAPLPPQRHGQVNLSPPHLHQEDLNPQWTFLPLCPPASPQSLLLDALWLSGSESVGPGLAGCVKDHPARSEPWTAPSTQSVGWVPESPRTHGSYEQAAIQTQRSCTSRDSSQWQRELSSWDAIFING